MLGEKAAEGPRTTIAVKFQHRDPEEFYKLFQLYALIDESNAVKDLVTFDPTSGILIFNGPVEMMVQEMGPMIARYDSPRSDSDDSISGFADKHDSVQVNIFTLKHRSAGTVAHFLNALFGAMSTDPPELAQMVNNSFRFFASENKLYFATSFDAKTTAAFLYILDPFIQACDQPQPLPVAKTPPKVEPQPQYAPIAPNPPVESQAEVSHSPYPAIEHGGYATLPQTQQPQPSQPYTVPAAVYISPQLQIYTPTQAEIRIPQPHYFSKEDESEILAVPFANRKAKDFMELLLCDEGYREISGLMFVDERSNTFIWVDSNIDPVSRSMYREMCRLFDQNELTGEYPDLESFLAQAESAVVETYPLKHRSAMDYCHFAQASLRSVKNCYPNDSMEGLLDQIAVFVDESDKTLIVARDASCDSFSAEYFKNNLARYDVPQTPGEPVSATPQEGKPVAQAFRLQNRNTAEFALLLRNHIKATEEFQSNVPVDIMNVYFDNNTQTLVVLHQNDWLIDILPSMVSFYDAQPGTISYAYANLGDFLAKNPGAKAKSFPMKNLPAETMCHFWRCYTSGNAGHEDATKLAFFADEKSQKLTVAHNINEDEFFSAIARFIELCEQEMTQPPHEGLNPPPQVQLENQYFPATDENPAPTFAYGDAFLENDVHGFASVAVVEEKTEPASEPVDAAVSIE